jgi:hypothetical protein
VISLWLRMRGWIYGLAAFAGLLLSAWLLGRSKGKAAEQGKTRAAQDAAATAKATNQQLESRHETDAEVQRLPDAPAQVVADADPATAAGRLQSWTRD